jgi:hypothetical protein
MALSMDELARATVRSDSAQNTLPRSVRQPDLSEMMVEKPQSSALHRFRRGKRRILRICNNDVGEEVAEEARGLQDHAIVTLDAQHTKLKRRPVRRFRFQGEFWVRQLDLSEMMVEIPQALVGTALHRFRRDERCLPRISYNDPAEEIAGEARGQQDHAIVTPVAPRSGPKLRAFRRSQFRKGSARLDDILDARVANLHVRSDSQA